MKIKSLLAFLALLVITNLLTACGGNAYAATSWPGLTVSNDVAYLAYNQQVYAVDLTNGSELGRYPQKADRNKTFYAAPALTPTGDLIVAGYDKVLYSLDPATMTEKFTFAQAHNRYIASPLVTAEGIFAPNADGSLYALDFELKPLWSQPFQVPTRQALWATPVTQPGCHCLYLPAMDKFLYVLDIQTGEERGKVALGAASVGTPAIADGILYLGTFNREMLAIDLTTRQIIHRYPTDGMVWGGAALADGRLYFGDIEGAFYILETPTLTEVKKTATDGAIVAPPLVTANAVYVTTESGSLYTFDLNGVERRPPQKFGSKETTKLYAPPILYGDFILLTPMDTDELLYAVGADGNQLWPPFIPEQ